MKKIVAFVLWAGVASAIMVLVTLPISLQTHLIAGTTVVAAMLLLKMFRPPHGMWRMITLALGTSIVLRYAYWRTTSTLPPLNQLQDFLPGLLVYVAEMYSVAMLALSLFVVSRPFPSRVAPHRSDAELPTVDIFVPSYNEDRNLLARTLAAAKGIDYPADKMTVYLLDDGGTEQLRASDRIVEANDALTRHAELQELCAALDVRYITRARNEHAKAGNLNNALARSSSEVVVVLDADHAPARDFLECTVGFFRDDPRLFLVQTQHFFLNPDPIERNLRTFFRLPSENEMFYGIVQRGLDKWNASLFCGSAAVLRRAALVEVGGFQSSSITEDCETALALHARGWESIYVDRPLIAGLQPASFASLIKQRSRWAQGMIQILLLKRPFFKRGLSIPQRLCYMSSILFWFFPLSRTVFMIAPLFYLFFNMQIFIVSGSEFLAYALTYMAVNLIMQNYLYGPYRWPWMSELYEYAQALYLLPAIASVLANPRKPTFRVTAKNEMVETDRLSEIAGPLFVFFGLLVLGLVMTGVRLVTQPYKADVTLVVGGWNLLNLVLAGCALGAVSERGERQVGRRVPVRRRCEILVGDKVLPATIENVSTEGAGIRLAGERETLLKGDRVEIRFAHPRQRAGSDTLPSVVRHTTAGKGSTLIGVNYVAVEASHFRQIAELLFANSEQWMSFQKARRYNPGLLRGTFLFYGMAIQQTVRGLFYLFKTAKPGRRTVRKPAAIGDVR